MNDWMNDDDDEFPYIWRMYQIFFLGVICDECQTHKNTIVYEHQLSLPIDNLEFWLPILIIFFFNNCVFSIAIGLILFFSLRMVWCWSSFNITATTTTITTTRIYFKVNLLFTLDKWTELNKIAHHHHNIVNYTYCWYDKRKMWTQTINKSDPIYINGIIEFILLLSFICFLTGYNIFCSMTDWQGSRQST